MNNIIYRNIVRIFEAIIGFCASRSSAKSRLQFLACKRLLVHSFILMVLNGCYEQDTRPVKLFHRLAPSLTGIHFSNDLVNASDFNINTYQNFYNGGGVAIGDINNDGLADVFLTANMLPNRLYLNKGNFKFEDITEAAGIGKKGEWSTGVSMADVNGDGLLDIYVCNSGDVKGGSRENELYINNGNVTFSERADAYGLNDKGLSTHAAFFDYDHDGDLDCYVLNNSFRPVGGFNFPKDERSISNPLGGDKLYRNDGTHFTDVSEQAGIYGSRIGYGLGVTVGDLDKDGWQDIYVSNDFFERDYLYLNNQDGTFKEVLEDMVVSISLASMGADMADINNDGYPEIFVTEMLPEDEGRLKTNTIFENWDKYQQNLNHGYYHQFSRNMLQLNNGGSSFSEIGRLAGVHASDWSWGALITDLNNDGFKDIFIANGIFKDLTNLDYITYVNGKEFYQRARAGKMELQDFIDLMPSRPVSNYAFSNNGDLTFTNKAEEWGLGDPSFSNGSAYGDLDNDGDLDLVVNNLNAVCSVYRNESMQRYPENKFLKVNLKGEGKNPFGVGAQVTVHYNGTIAYQEQVPNRGFESTVEQRLHFGLGKTDLIDSVVVKWPDGREYVVDRIKPNQEIIVKQNQSSGKRHVREPAKDPLFVKSQENHGLDFQHEENDFIDFNHTPLIYHMLSTNGPRIAKGDVNSDGLEDIFVGGAKGQAGALYIQTAEGNFKKTNQGLFIENKESEDTDALFFDAEGDGDVDLYIASGGNEYSPDNVHLADRLYLNDGRGIFRKPSQALPPIFESSSCVSAADFDSDGDLDLFVGGRLELHHYGYPGNGYLLQNNGKALFEDVTSKVAPELARLGMITDAEWADYDQDGHLDLVLAGEYMPIKLFRNFSGNKLKDRTDSAGLSRSNGWWNRIHVADVDVDGYPDIIGANHGLNSRFKASEQKPVRMYVSDFDDNGSIEQILTTYNGAHAYPFALRHDLVAVLPGLKKKYLKYESYQKQTIEDIFTNEQLERAVRLNAYTFESTVFMNNRKGSFLAKVLPTQVQFSAMYGIAVDDLDADGNMDILMGGNFYQAKPEVGIYDATHCIMLKGDGEGDFVALPANQSGIHIKGAVRDIVKLGRGERGNIWVFARNNSSVVLLEENKL